MSLHELIPEMERLMNERTKALLEGNFRDAVLHENELIKLFRENEREIDKAYPELDKTWYVIFQIAYIVKKTGLQK